LEKRHNQRTGGTDIRMERVNEPAPGEVLPEPEG